MSKYDFQAIETKWQAFWEQQKTFKSAGPGEEGFDASKPKYYVLDMFPYPSGIGLHVGHPLGYIATDIVSRYKRMKGFNVLHPMGFDAFGLPAEQFAVDNNVHPADFTWKNINNMIRQLKAFGLSYDWDRMVATIEPDYYKWTQWIFLKLYNSWFDPADQKAKPIQDLIERLESGKLQLYPSGDIYYPEFRELESIGGTAVGVLQFHELTPEEQHAIIENQRLAFISEVPVNWCPALGTVLANEEVTNEGRSERGNHPVYRRPLKQWMLRITAYCERLIDDLDLVDWPEAIKLMQRNWIGKSEGANVDFPIQGFEDHVIQVYTTRPDTLFGATYMVLAPEHPLVNEITSEEQQNVIDAYIAQAANKSERDRAMETKDKTGAFTGAYAINPVNNTKIPVWIADYVMMGYGTGAIMAVPAHDQRDYDFAKAFNLPILDVVHSKGLASLSHALLALADHPRRVSNGIEFITAFVNKALTDAHLDYDLIWEAIEDDHTRQTWANKKAAWSELSNYLEHDLDKLIGRAETARLIDLMGQALPANGVLVNSSNKDISLNDYSVEEAKERITLWLDDQGLGNAQVQYKLRDWLFSRQRYWGEPFPMLHGEDGELMPVHEDDLPVELPQMSDFKPVASDDPDAPPSPPLGKANDDWRLFDADNGKSYTRELNTMPQWAGSCWYYLRYIDPENNSAMVDPAKENYWMGDNGIDLYVGGAEHAVLHLLYARFWHKVLFDLGHVSTPEPFGKLFNQGYIQAYCYRDERGVAVDATKVVDQDGKPAMEVQDEPGREFFYEGQSVKQEYGKMGKSLKNAVNPDDIFGEYGCDTLRLYEMYMGPLEQSKPWNTRDIVGPGRFLQRVWRNFINEETNALKVDDVAPSEDIRKLLHQTVKRVSEDMERMAFNTAIAALIELNNALVSLEKLPREVAESFVLMLSPMAPHIAEELWQRLGYQQSLCYAEWPTWDESILKEDSIELVVQIKGKVRGRITVAVEADENTIMKTIHEDDRLGPMLQDVQIVKTIIVPGKLVNLVTK